MLQAQYEAFREKVIIAERFGGEPTWLDAYGAVAIDEFFAVACEAYFVNRPRFEREFPPLPAPLRRLLRRAAAHGRGTAPSGAAAS